MTRRLVSGLAALFIAVPLLALPNPAQSQSTGVRPSSSTKNASARPDDGCFPACRSGYVCHPTKLECVSACNPACDDDEVCTEDATCVPDPQSAEPALPELGDRRFRILLLGRFGFVGKATLGVTRDGPSQIDADISARPENATMGFDLRFEKPVAKNVSVGALLSNYFIRPGGSVYDIAFFGSRRSGTFEYAADLAPFVKARIPFRVGEWEGEVYFELHFGASLLALNNVLEAVNLSPSRFVHPGFNVGAAPGVQILVSKNFGLVFEIGYAYSWFRVRAQRGLTKFTLGQLTLRPGFVFAF